MENIAHPTAASMLSRVQSALTKFLAVLWRFFVNPLPLLIVAIVALALVLAAMVVPQIPGPIQTDPAATARWMQSVTGSYARTGSLLESLGIFSLLQSDLLRVLLVLIALMLAVQFADQIGRTTAMRRLPARMMGPVDEAGMAVSLAYGGFLFRFREAASGDVEPLAQEVQASLSGRFNAVKEARVVVPAEDVSEAEAGDDDPQAESRILAVRNQIAAYLRPLLTFGLLVGLLGLWLNVVFGWEVIAPSLPPTASFSYPLRDLAVAYPATGQGGTGLAPVLQINLGDVERRVAVDEAARMGPTSVIVRPSVPALLVRAEPTSVLLARPGDSTKVSALGLEFPVPGREESLVLPAQAIGIRIVRQPDSQYAIEFYRAGSAAPFRRIMLAEEGIRRVTLPGVGATVTFVPTVGAVAAVRAKPGDPLYWFAGVLVLLGLIGYVRNPAFVVVQLAGWSPDRTVVVAQSNVRDELDLLQTRIHQRDAED